MGGAQDEELVWIKPLDKLFSINFRISYSLVADREHIHHMGGFLSASSGISSATYLCGGSLLASFCVNKGKKL